ncbi:MAG TPA: PH domain-containing protein [Eubacteriales bacterium]|jgi:hypothetical protein|nr:PH domain-containing protein [Eubacteriales bacterium]HRU84200.1 PH domain-containing protein [Eubacteriales bacterium]
MRYIESHLPKSQRIVAKARFSAWVYLRELFVAAVLGGGIYLLYYFKVIGFGDNLMWYVIAGAAGLVLLLFIQNTLNRMSNELILTENRLIGRRGILSIKMVDVALPNISNTESFAGLFGRMLGYGKVAIKIQDTSHIYKNVVRPDAFIAKIGLQTARLRKNEQGENIVIKFGLATERVKARRRAPMDEKTRAALEKLQKKNK